MKRTTVGTCSLLAAIVMFAGACVPAPPKPATGLNPNSAPRAGEAAYAQHGPFEVGVTTLQMSDRKVEVWYPVNPEDIGKVIGRNGRTRTNGVLIGQANLQRVADLRAGLSKAGVILAIDGTDKVQFLVKDRQGFAGDSRRGQNGIGHECFL